MRVYRTGYSGGVLAPWHAHQTACFSSHLNSPRWLRYQLVKRTCKNGAATCLNVQLHCSPKKMTSQNDIIPSSALYSLFTIKTSHAESVEKDQQNCKYRRDELQKQVLVYTINRRTNSLICCASFLLRLSLMAPAMCMFSVTS